MTALAMILGMLPMSLALGAGGEQNAPLGPRRDRRSNRGDLDDAVRGTDGILVFRRHARQQAQRDAQYSPRARADRSRQGIAVMMLSHRPRKSRDESL